MLLSCSETCIYSVTSLYIFVIFIYSVTDIGVLTLYICEKKRQIVETLPSYLDLQERPSSLLLSKRCSY